MKLFGFDLETCLLQPAQAAPPAVCMTCTDRVVLLPHGELAASAVEDVELFHFAFDRDALRARFMHALETCMIVGLNTPYDLGVMLREFPDLWELVFRAYDENRVFDVDLAQKLIDIGTDVSIFWQNTHTKPSGYGLEKLALRHLGVKLDKDSWRLLYGLFRDVPLSRWREHARQVRPDLDPESVITYPKGDARTTLNICAKQCETINASMLLADLYNQTRAAFWIHLMVAHGFQTDPRAVRALRERIEKERDEVAFRLRRAGLLRPDDSRDTKAAAARMVEACRARGVEPKLTDGGESGQPKIALDEESCELSGDPILRMYARYSSLDSIWGSIPKLEKGVIQSRFELAETGRTTCNEGEKEKGADGKKVSQLNGFQLQNPRREPGIRECFVPRPGCVLWSVDYGQMELHTWAQVCLVLVGRSKLAEALNNKIDAHVLLACNPVLHPDWSYDVANANKKKQPYKDARQASKAGNFGFPGGLGWKRFMEYAKANYGVTIGPDDSKKLREAWLSMWPEAHDYFAIIHSICGERGWGVIQQLYSKRIRAGVGFTEAANGFFQALAADCAKHAGWEIAKACYLASKRSPLYGSRVVDFAHDEFIGESPSDRAHDAALEVGKIMEASGRIWCPDVPPRTEPAMMLRWRKAAEPYWIEVDGEKRLAPWDTNPAVRETLLAEGTLFD